MTATSTRTDSATGLRRVAALGTAVSAVVHGYLFLDGWSAVTVTGPLFALNAVAGVVIAVALIASAHWAWRFLAVGFNALSLAALALSHTPRGFFGLRESYWDIWQVMALVSESVGLFAAALALLAWWRGRR
ncbi:MAG TPA: hypothetical protein VKY71_10485 [Actinotalea caeni]|uniref:hypothetical protein n=1 Tax=Actinotalea caeni TaxID=1348467 RepID=UPI002B4AD76B|nr:hypothetical protein [Actinotalea caeni]HLV55985.1 hypothetical protein [Actinotalea caeni]